MPARPQDILEADHRELETLLAATIEAICSGDLERSYSTVDLFWARLAIHIRAEHLHVFPAILASETGDTSRTAAAVIRLRADHEMFIRELARAVKALRLAFSSENVPETLNVVGTLLDDVRRGLEVHNEIEEKEIYTLLEAPYIDPRSLPILATGIKKELGNYPPRLHRAK